MKNVLKLMSKRLQVCEDFSTVLAMKSSCKLIRIIPDMVGQIKKVTSREVTFRADDRSRTGDPQNHKLVL
jgi:hypothetical protein